MSAVRSSSSRARLRETLSGGLDDDWAMGSIAKGGPVAFFSLDTRCRVNNVVCFPAPLHPPFKVRALPSGLLAVAEDEREGFVFL